MLKRLYIHNYKCLTNFELELGPVNLFLGPNGSGKSAVLEVLHGVRAILAAELPTADAKIFEPSLHAPWQAEPNCVFECESEHEGGHYKYRLTVRLNTQTGKSETDTEGLWLNGKPLFEFRDGQASLHLDGGSQPTVYPAQRSGSVLGQVPERPETQTHTAFLRFMRDFDIIALRPNMVKSWSSTEDSHLALDGHNLIAWYRFVSSEYQHLVSEYQAQMLRVLDGLTGIRVKQAGPEHKTVLLDFSGNNTNYHILLADLSDGQKILFALYALAIFMKGRKFVLCIDEPDNFVSSREIQPWLTLLRDTCMEHQGQAILISHHPECIDYLGPDCGIWFYRDGNGPTRVKKVQADPDSPLKLSEQIARGWYGE